MHITEVLGYVQLNAINSLWLSNSISATSHCLPNSASPSVLILTCS